MEYPIHVFEAGQSSRVFPEWLWDMEDRPERIFIEGEYSALSLLQLLPDRGLGVVGTRYPQAKSIAIVKKSLGNLRGSQLLILSGLARGIDSMAHEAALEAQLPTLAFVAHGLDTTYPPENEDLRQRILGSGGLVISEYSEGAPALPHSFLQRNRFIAAWSKALWVVEAGEKSGALNTAMWARKHDRACYVLPSFPGEAPYLGNQRLLEAALGSLPFYSSNSLGATWLELSSSAERKTKKRSNVLTLPFTDEARLTSIVREFTSKIGGIQVPDLLDWAISEAWSPDRFYRAFSQAVQDEMIEDHEGVLISL